jgi:hypothetical protein
MQLFTWEGVDGIEGGQGSGRQEVRAGYPRPHERDSISDGGGAWKLEGNFGHTHQFGVAREEPASHFETLRGSHLTMTEVHLR